MFSFLILAADLGDAEAQLGLHRIQERRLANAALSGDDALFAGDQPTQRFDALTRRGTDEVHTVSHLTIDAGNGHEIGRINEIDLVDADDGLDLHPLGFDQKAINQIRFQFWLGGAGYDQQLIDIRHEDLLPAFAHAAEDVTPRFDPLDQTVIPSLRAKP